jgi:hypothetical protein
MVSIKTFACKNCGAAVEDKIKGWSVSIVCSSCGAVIDLSSEEKKVIGLIKNIKEESGIEIPLGSRGKLKDIEWEVIGFLKKRDTKYFVVWQEYLLFNPKYGFAWLTQVNGHWNFMRSTKQMVYVHGSKATVSGQHYTLYNRGEAQVIYALGEFYWKIKTKDTVKLIEYICPPYVLSCEGSKDELVWTQGSYLELHEIEEAFNLEHYLPEKVGVASNQVSPHKNNHIKILTLAVAFLGTMLLLQVCYWATSPNQMLFKERIPLSRHKSSEFVSKPFKIDKQTNLQIAMIAPVTNTWVHTITDLVNIDNGNTLSFEHTLERYKGYEDGESWEEGRDIHSEIISSVPKGNYHLVFESTLNPSPELTPDLSGGINSPNDIVVFAKYGVPVWSNCGIAFFLLVIPVFVNYFLHFSFEKKRWANSDFAPYIFREEEY